MKILVTGGCGFIGSHVVDKLIEKGHEPIVVHRPTCDSKNIDNKDVRVYDCDIREISKLGSVIKHVDSIVHMAALINVDQSIQDPWIFWDVNVKGTVELLEIARKYKKRVINFSSCEVYGNIPTGKATEEHPTNPRSPYAVSKFAAERYCLTYGYTYDLPVTILRGFNCFGPRQSAAAYGAVIPKFISKVQKNMPPLIFGEGSQTRDFVYATDMADGIVRAVENKGIDGEVIHFATGRDHSVNDLAGKIIRLSNKKLKPEFIKGRPGELMRSVGNYSKAKKLLGWEPKVNFDEGLKKTMKWFENNQGDKHGRG